MKSGGFFSKIVLGLLVAATGVGAGDLITASLAGSRTGVVLLWAALVGAILKWVLNEGLARWQMATGQTLLEGWVGHLGRWIQWAFLVYLLLWSYAVGGALISACGVAAAGLFPLADLEASKIIWGVIHSLAGFALVWSGRFKIFEYVMSVCVGLMVVAVLASVVIVAPDWGVVSRGLLAPSFPRGGEAWLLGVLGGVGGTVTIMSYGYWVREKKRSGRRGVRESRLDLGVAYGLTAFFGAAMIIIGSKVQITGRGAAVALVLADALAQAFGPAGKWLFLVGFWGAVFTSLLGVWQGVPYLFADFINLRRGRSLGREDVDIKKTPAYRAFLAALTFLPMSLLWLKVQQVQLAYAVLGALFMPLVALTLLLLNNRPALVGREFRNSLVVNVLLAATLVFFSYLGVKEIINLILGQSPILSG
ncbi:MAG: Nramp family divalent metal transporter [Candidatus Aminicenantes bacterium]|nr:Nramp family divalent metal transporter [Candidatus Aminicenantes bacterium]